MPRRVFLATLPILEGFPARQSCIKSHLSLTDIAHLFTSTVPMRCGPGSRTHWQRPRRDRSGVAPRGIGERGQQGGADASACSGNGESVCVKQGSQTGVNKPPRAFPRARDRESGHSRCAEFRRRPALGRPAHVRALIVSARHVAVCHDTPGEGDRIAGTEPSRFPARIAASSPQASTAGTALSPPTENPRVYSESERTHAVGRAGYGDGLSSKKQEPSHVCQGEPCLG